MSQSHPLKAGDHVYLIDGSGYIFRAYHALPPLTRKSDGLPVGAVQGFCNMLWKLLRELRNGEKPSHIAVIFDHSAKSFRTDFYPDYKAHRPEPPADLRPQFGLIRQATRAFNVACVEQENYEADDLIATYARQAVEAGATCRIVSSDKDLMQLVRPGVTLYDTMKEKDVGELEVFEKFGVKPDKVIDVQALAGDSVDNVPGVPGIGEKSAGPIIAELDLLFDELLKDPNRAGEFKGILRERLSGCQTKLDNLAGEPVKLSSQTQIANVLSKKFGIEVQKKDKKGVPCADTATVEELAAKGNEFCKELIRARNIERLEAKHIDLIVANIDKARISKRLVTLDDQVPVIHDISSFAVDEPRASQLVGFGKALEFSTFTKKVAGELGAEMGAIDAIAIEIKFWPPEGGVGVAAEASPRRSFTPQRKAAPSAPAPELIDIKAMPFTLDAYEIIATPQALRDWLLQVRGDHRLAVDLQATSEDAMRAEIAGFALAIAPGRAAYVPVGHTAREELMGRERLDGQMTLAEALAELKPLLESPSFLTIGHDIKFDMELLARHGVKLSGHDDVMLLSYAFESGLTHHTLAALADRHLGYRLHDMKQVLGTGRTSVSFERLPLEQAATVAGEAADATQRLWSVLRGKLRAAGKTTVYETLERPLVPVLAGMEMAGISVDPAVLQKLSHEFKTEIAGIEKEIYGLAGESFNIGSPKQLGDILFGKMGIPGGKKTATGAWSTDAETLEDLAGQGIELARKVVDWRQLFKLLSNYTEALPGFINPETNRVHTSYVLASTSTGRLSSTEPNLQNIPIRTEEGRKIRRAFVAPQGSKLISADYSQIELRVFAHVANIPELKQAFAKGQDIHAMTASEMFGVPVAGMDPAVRRRAKAINFGIIYGISAFGLASQLSISREEAGNYIKTYFQRFPGIRVYMDEMRRRIHELGYVETIFGRRCHFPRAKSPNASERSNAERAAINAPIQGAAADIIRRAMIRMPKALADAGLSARMLLQVHDELIFEAIDAEVEGTRAVVKKVMEQAAEPAVKLTVPLQVDARAAANWDEAH